MSVGVCVTEGVLSTVVTGGIVVEAISVTVMVTGPVPEGVPVFVTVVVIVVVAVPVGFGVPVFVGFGVPVFVGFGVPVDVGGGVVAVTEDTQAVRAELRIFPAGQQSAIVSYVDRDKHFLSDAPVSSLTSQTLPDGHKLVLVHVPRG